tara:strand:- start:802 stop:1410 length:609 start_codon:yes stop_codon:yes gene_type:complete
MLGLGTGLMYPENVFAGDTVINVSAASANTLLDDAPDDTAVRVGVFFSDDQANAYTAMGLTSPVPDVSEIAQRINGTFDFTITRHTFDMSAFLSTGNFATSFVATSDTVTVTGKTGYAASLVADNAVIFIAPNLTSATSNLNSDFYEGGTELFDLSSLGGDITDNSVLNNYYVAQVTYNPPSGFAGSVTANATSAIQIDPGA